MKKSRKELAEELVFLLMKLQKKVFDKSRCAAASYGLTPVQWQILRILKKEPAGTTEIAEMLGTSKSAVSQQVDILVKKGLIEVFREEKDRRRRYLSLSQKTQELFKDFQSDLTASFVEVFESLELEEIESLISILKKAI